MCMYSVFLFILFLNNSHKTSNILLVRFVVDFVGPVARFWSLIVILLIKREQKQPVFLLKVLIKL